MWLLLAALPVAGLACDDDDADGLDVALVFSGGGALATTHIGALTVIEELGVPIHCVVGTSMGAVVAGLYAAGYDSAGLREIFRDSRWPEAFSGRVGRRDEPYLRKEQSDLYFSGYVAGVQDGELRLPAGFRSMAGLQRLFRQLLPGITVDQGFDDLPTPYRAVAMDLSSGEAVALDQGDLVEAMLASMAVPGVFAPRRVDGRVLVDGGMAAQLPVSVAQEMGADIIIALDTTVEPPEALPSWSVAQVSQQLIRHTVWRNWLLQRERLGKKDVLIRPELEGLTTASFQRAGMGFELGEAEAQTHREALLEVRRLAAPQSPRGEPSPATQPATLVVSTASPIDETLIVNRFGYEPSDFERPERLQRKLKDLAAFGPFRETDLALVDADTARLQAEPLHLGRNLISAGFRASNNFEGDSTYAVLGRLTRRPFGAGGSELRISGLIGTDTGLAVEYHQPFGSEARFFVTPAAAYWGEEYLIQIEDVRLGEFWQETGEARLRLGRELADWGIIAADAIVSTVNTSTEIALLPIGSESANYLGGGLLFGVDTLDRAEWPGGGVQLRAHARFLNQLGGTGGTSENYRLKFIKPFRLAGWDVILRGDAQTIDNDPENPVDILRLGGFRRLSSFAENTLLSDRYVLGSVEIFRRLNPSDALVSVPLYVGVLLEYGDVELELIEPALKNNYQSIAPYLGMNTALGPLFFGAGFGRDGSANVFLHFGRSF